MTLKSKLIWGGAIALTGLGLFRDNINQATCKKSKVTCETTTMGSGHRTVCNEQFDGWLGTSHRKITMFETTPIR